MVATARVVVPVGQLKVGDIVHSRFGLVEPGFVETLLSQTPEDALENSLSDPVTFFGLSEGETSLDIERDGASLTVVLRPEDDISRAIFEPYYVRPSPER